MTMDSGEGTHAYRIHRVKCRWDKGSNELTCVGGWVGGGVGGGGVVWARGGGGLDEEGKQGHHSLGEDCST
jgi:hypothetical protein